MTASDFDREWEKLAREVVSGMKEWRIQHPRATWKELEEALDQRLNRMRARLLEDMALASEAARLQEEGARALSAVRGAASVTGKKETEVANQRRGRDCVGTEVRCMSHVSGGDFSPWMKSYSCCLGD